MLDGAELRQREVLPRLGGGAEPGVVGEVDERRDAARLGRDGARVAGEHVLVTDERAEGDRLGAASWVTGNVRVSTRELSHHSFADSDQWTHTLMLELTAALGLGQVDSRRPVCDGHDMMRVGRRWAVPWALAASGACGGGSSETTAGSTADTTAVTTEGASAGMSNTGPSVTTSVASTDGTTEQQPTGGSVNCGLGGADDQHFLTGTFVLTDVLEGMVPMSDVFAPLLNVEVCFGVTFAAEVTVLAGQTRVSMTDVSLQTDDPTGVVAATFGPATTGLLTLRPQEVSPTVLVLSLGVAQPMGDEQFTFELGCMTPTGFELDGGGVPVYQSMVCQAGTAWARRFVVGPGQQDLSDIVLGAARFELHVP